MNPYFNPKALAILLGYYFFVNVLIYWMMGADKKRAMQGKWRIPEKRFFLLAALGGGIGGLCGMFRKRHKTRHLSFLLVYSLTAILHGALLFLWIGKFALVF